MMAQFDAKAWKRLSIRHHARFTVFDSSTAFGRLKCEIVHGRLAFAACAEIAGQEARARRGSTGRLLG
jgi:hypothetical protein